jgi:hypothetical protein
VRPGGYVLGLVPTVSKTRSGMKGIMRIGTPVASNMALPLAAGTGQMAGSPAPGGL